MSSDEPCTASVTKEISIHCEEAVAVFIPAAFTPDNDGKNEWFVPVFSHPADFTLQVFNRWGKKIFNGKNTGWNGRTENGLLCPQGVICTNWNGWIPVRKKNQYRQFYLAEMIHYCI